VDIRAETAPRKLEEAQDSLKDVANNTKDIRAEVDITKCHKIEVNKAKIVLAIDDPLFLLFHFLKLKLLRKLSLNLLTSAILFFILHLCHE
jgi:hypothetical protein